MPPEAAVGAAFPPAEIAAFTDADGTGSVQFEVRSDVENESLGCNDKVACSIVVIPINGLSLRPAVRAADDGRQRLPQGRPVPAGLEQLRQRGRRPGGVPGAVVVGLQLGATGSRSRSPSACRRTPATCSTRGAPTGFYGSELLAQAALQWSPAYCLNKDRFKFQHNPMSDEAGFEPDGERRRRGRRGVVQARAARDRPGRLRADRGDRLRDRLRHRPAGQRRRVHRPAAERPAGRQAAHPVLSRLRPRPRAPGHRGQPAGDHERPGVPASSTRA